MRTSTFPYTIYLILAVFSYIFGNIVINGTFDKAMFNVVIYTFSV